MDTRIIELHLSCFHQPIHWTFLKDLNLLPDSPGLEHCICRICNDLIKTPPVVNNCDHAFCGLCLTIHLKNDTTCPICVTDIPAHQQSVRLENSC